MKKLGILACSCALLFAGNVYAATNSGRAVEEAGQTSAHASASAAHGIAASGQATSAAAAVPVGVSGAASVGSGAAAGSVGSAGIQAADNLMKAATAPADGPLPVSDETITAGPPPNKALAPKQNTPGTK